jgi:hypothetical protein
MRKLAGRLHARVSVMEELRMSPTVHITMASIDEVEK